MELIDNSTSICRRTVGIHRILFNVNLLFLLFGCGSDHQARVMTIFPAQDLFRPSEWPCTSWTVDEKSVRTLSCDWRLMGHHVTDRILHSEDLSVGTDIALLLQRRQFEDP